MTLIDVEDFLEDVRGKMWDMTLNELEDLVNITKQYGFDETISDELIQAYYDDDIDAYMRKYL